MPVGFSGTNNCANVESRVALDTRNGHWPLTEDSMLSESRRKPIVPVRNLGVLWPAPNRLLKKYQISARSTLGISIRRY